MSLWTGEISDQAMKIWLIEAQAIVESRTMAAKTCLYYKRLFAPYENTISQGRQIYHPNHYAFIQ